MGILNALKSEVILTFRCKTSEKKENIFIYIVSLKTLSKKIIMIKSDEFRKYKIKESTHHSFDYSS